MIKAVVLYGHPQDTSAFEQYYADSHLRLVAKMEDTIRIELTRFESGADGIEPAYYRMAELYFPNKVVMEKALASPEGVAAIEDLSNFATGGVSLLVGSVDD